MAATHTFRLVKIATVGVVAFLAICGCESGEESERRPSEPATETPGVQPAAPTISSEDVASFIKASEDGLEEHFTRWSEVRANDKLYIAQRLLQYVAIAEKRDGGASPAEAESVRELYEIAGRAAQGLEQILGVSLPDVGPESSREEVGAVHAEASRLVEAYRSGVVARAADDPVPPKKLAALRKKYHGKMQFGGPDATGPWEQLGTMRALLQEWPPIGRKYEDLVAIIGARGDGFRPSPEEDLFVRYIFESGLVRRLVVFTVRNGIIRKVMWDTQG